MPTTTFIALRHDCGCSTFVVGLADGNAVPGISHIAQAREKSGVTHEHGATHLHVVKPPIRKRLR